MGLRWWREFVVTTRFFKQNLSKEKVCYSEPVGVICSAMPHFGATIRALRVSHELTLPALADRAGISKGLLSQIETDEKSNPSLSTLCKIAGGLGLTAADILKTDRAVLNPVAPELGIEFRRQLASAFGCSEEDMDADIITSLQHLRNRKGTQRDDIEHWKFLYTSIKNSFKR